MGITHATAATGSDSGDGKISKNAWNADHVGGIVPNVIYAECNSPAATGGNAPLPWDTFYDKAQGDITSGITAALAALGLTRSSNVFTATVAGIFHLQFNPTCVAAPAGQANEAALYTSGYLSDPHILWNSSSPVNPPDGRTAIPFTVYLGVGETFQVYTVATGSVTAGVVNYALMSIMKVA